MYIVKEVESKQPPARVFFIGELKMKALKSCDIILCSGNGSLSRKIRWFNRVTGVKGPAADLSHVAMYADIVCNGAVFESTTLNEFSSKTGVQENEFSRWLRHYNGKVWVRKFDFDRTLEFENQFRCFIHNHLGDKYEHGIAGYAELLLAGLRLDRYIRMLWKPYRPLSTRSPHCSELDVTALQFMDLCKMTAIPSRMPPSTFWPGQDLDTYLKVKLGPPEKLK